MPLRIVAAALLLAAVPAAAASPTPREVLEASDRARGKLPGVVWTVDLRAVEGGRETAERLEVKAAGKNALAEVLSPPRSKGQMLLFQGRNLWFIKPGVRKPVPISPRQKMLGQAANGDLASTDYSGDYDGTFAEEGLLEGEPCHVLELTARTKNVTYDRITYWVSKKRLVGLKADFYTVSGKKFKSARFEYDNAVHHQGMTIPFVSRMTITDELRPADRTVLQYSGISVRPLSDSTFNLGLLVR